MMNPPEEVSRIFALQTGHFSEIRQSSAKERTAKLRKLQRGIETYRPEIEKALYADLRKSPAETSLSEILPVIAEIKHALRHLKTWMTPQKVDNPIMFSGASAEIRYEPKGTCLILAPWNFPFQLTLGPLISAIAAGNCAVVKPSEISAHTSAVIHKIISSLFEEREIAIIEGDQAVASALLEQPFHHIFFTGSPAVGSIVMQAAAKHLSSVTLELGGKSPVIIDESANISDAADKIVWGKCLNAGQACVAPDYILLPKSKHDEFVLAVKQALAKYYPDIRNTPDYCRIINDRHFARLQSALQSAVAGGAQMEAGGAFELSSRFLEPTILSNVKNESKLLQEEIFGPVLPLVTYSSLREAISFIAERERPLALYLFSNHSDTIEFILKNTYSGAACINNVVFYFANVNLPFGGVNHSGFGNSHGFYGFRAFSYERAVIRQPKFNFGKFLYPPYTEKVKKLIKLTIKYFT